MIPKLSAPLVKAIRTTEGIVLAIAAAIPWVVTLVDPSKLPASVATHWSVYAAMALAVSRTAIKVVTALKGATGIEPAPVDTESLAQKVADKIHATVPTKAEITGAINAAIAAVEHPEGILSGIEKVAEGALSSSEEIAATPSDPSSPPDGNNALLGAPVASATATVGNPAITAN